MAEYRSIWQQVIDGDRITGLGDDVVRPFRPHVFECDPGGKRIRIRRQYEIHRRFEIVVGFARKSHNKI